MTWIIYKHTKKNSNKCYIGQTKQDPERRWRDGEGYLKDGQDTHFSRAIKKYGWNAFWHEIIEDNIQSIDVANDRETFWIRFYDSVQNGYNSNYGGGCREWTDESRIKASISHKGKKITGLHLLHLQEAARLSAKDPERNKKISDALKGRAFSEEHKFKISQNAKNRTGELNPFFGKHHSESTIEHYKKLFGKRVACLETGAAFVSSNEAGRILGIDAANIRSACRLGIQAKIGKKWFHFYYIDEEMPAFKNNNIKQVYNIDTNEIFENLIDAGKSVNKSSKLIGMCCRGIVETAGGCHWAYYDEFKKLSSEQISQLKSKNVIGKGRKKSVLCIETQIVYDSTSEASRQTGIKQSSIAKVASNKQLTAGGYHWKYVDE